MTKMSDIDIFYRIQKFRSHYRKQHGHDLEVMIETDAGWWGVELGMEGWATKLGNGSSEHSLDEAWEGAVMSLLFDEHNSET